MKRFKGWLIPAFMVVVFTGFVSVDEAYGQLDTILKRMDDHNKALVSIRAKVTMSKQNAQLGGSPDIVKGNVIYKAIKGRNAADVRVDWIKPEENFSIIGDQYIIYRPRLNQVIKGSTKNAGGNAKAGGALAFMNMSRGQLKANYSVVYLGEATLASGVVAWHLRLTPKQPTSYKSAEIWVDQNGMPNQSKVIENNNDSTTILLESIEKNIRLEKNAFKIAYPKNAREVKG
ncbi:MAG TPA: hypothetical protein DEA22_10670 [Blastocatellia bacterium]|nr:hypothetical protein [Blastocatellia bacterium]